ncbi:hypothetical protein ACYZT4_05580 [Pseudomonas sp. GB2N2]
MREPVSITTDKGTICAFTQVEVCSLATTFAMVTRDGWACRRAIRIGSNIDAEGEAFFCVGDKVAYTVIEQASGEPPVVEGLIKIETE